MDETPNINSQLHNLEALEKFIEARVNERLKIINHDPYESDKTDEICAALSKAQGEFQPIHHNRQNNFLFNQYSDLDVIMQAVRPALEKNGLSITQQVKLIDDKTILVTRLRHDSAQFIETRARIIPAKNDIQTYMSFEKAMKRDSIMSLLNITIVDDLDDDDGEHDMQTIRKERTKGTGINTRYAAKKESFEPLSQHEANELQYMLANYPDIAEQILETLKVQTIADIPKSKFGPVREQAQKIINTREGKNR